MAVYDLLIIGGGVSGTALLFETARFSSLERIALLEKYAAPARVNSQPSNNSQTLHCGDIETNYTLDKARTVKRAASMVVNYALRQADHDHLVYKYPKMVLGVGSRECRLLRDRFKVFGPDYPDLKLYEKRDIARLEPAVAMHKGAFRKQEVVALGSEDEYTAVNYDALSRSFVREALKVKGKTLDVNYKQDVVSIRRDEDGVFLVETRDTTYRAHAVVACAGGHSLKLAHDMGFGLDFSVLPVAGSYYFTPDVLKGKVYTVQNDKLPFAAIHGDPDVTVPGKTRFGPTALILPLLERYNIGTFKDWLKVFRFDRNVAKVLWDLLKVGDIRNYILKNFLFEVPLLRRILFLRDARKIVPDLKLRDVKFANGFGGIRPQMIDKVNHKLLLGEGKIGTDIGITFNLTPSPGGTSCLANAETDMREVCAFLGAEVDEEAFKSFLLTPIEEADDDPVPFPRRRFGRAGTGRVRAA